MRIYLSLTKNNKTIPYNYQELLTGTIHKWIGKENEIHGESGAFSFSWLQNTISNKNGIDLMRDAYFFISSLNEELIRKIIKNVIEDPTMFNGINVFDIQIKNTPQFEPIESFFMASPVLLKLREGEKTRHVTLKDNDFEQVLTDNLKRKLEKVGLSSAGIEIRLNPDFNYRNTKMVDYKGIKNRASFAPIIIKGTQEQIAFAWNQGLGNSTGIGFGALK